MSSKGLKENCLTKTPMPRRDSRMPIEFEGLDRLAHRIAADAELLGEERLGGQRIAGLEIVLLDIGLQALLHA